MVNMSEEDNIFRYIDEIKERCMNDPDLYKQMENYQKKFGTLTEDDLKKKITI